MSVRTWTISNSAGKGYLNSGISSLWSAWLCNCYSFALRSLMWYKGDHQPTAGPCGLSQRWWERTVLGRRPGNPTLLLTPPPLSAAPLGHITPKTGVAQVTSGQAHVKWQCPAGLGGCCSPSSLCPVSSINLGSVVLAWVVNNAVWKWETENEAVK